MRIVHEIESAAQVGGGGSLYAKAKGQEKSSGFRADILISIDSEHAIVPDEAIHIEGNAKHVLAALRDAVAILESCAEHYVAEEEMDPDWYKGAKERFTGRAARNAAP